MRIIFEKKTEFPWDREREPQLSPQVVAEVVVDVANWPLLRVACMPACLAPTNFGQLTMDQRGDDEGIRNEPKVDSQSSCVCAHFRHQLDHK